MNYHFPAADSRVFIRRSTGFLYTHSTCTRSTLHKLQVHIVRRGTGGCFTMSHQRQRPTSLFLPPAAPQHLTGSGGSGSGGGRHGVAAVSTSPLNINISSSPGVSPLRAAAAAPQLSTGEANTRDWQRMRQAVVGLFHRKTLSSLNITISSLQANANYKKLLETPEVFMNYYEQELLTRGMIIIRERIKECQGRELIEKLADDWDYFFTIILPLLECIMLPVESALRDAGERQDAQRQAQAYSQMNQMTVTGGSGGSAGWITLGRRSVAAAFASRLSHNHHQQQHQTRPATLPSAAVVTPEQQMSSLSPRQSAAHHRHSHYDNLMHPSAAATALANIFAIPSHLQNIEQQQGEVEQEESDTRYHQELQHAQYESQPTNDAYTDNAKRPQVTVRQLSIACFRDTVLFKMTNSVTDGIKSYHRRSDIPHAFKQMLLLLHGLRNDDTFSKYLAVEKLLALVVCPLIGVAGVYFGSSEPAILPCAPPTEQAGNEEKIRYRKHQAPRRGGVPSGTAAGSTLRHSASTQALPTALHGSARQGSQGNLPAALLQLQPLIECDEKRRHSFSVIPIQQQQ